MTELTEMTRPTLECPYCKNQAPLVESAVAYGGRDYGRLAYYCRSCDASVGCHEGTTKPLGTMANAELRALRIAVHKVFDPIYEKVHAARQRKDPKYSKGKARKDCYVRLAERMGMPADVCHIANFDVAQCKRAIEILRGDKGASRSASMRRDTQAGEMREPVEGDSNDLADGYPREQCSRPAEEAKTPSGIDAESLVDSIRRHIEPIGGVDLELPPREALREPVNLDE